MTLEHRVNQLTPSVRINFAMMTPIERIRSGIMRGSQESFAIIYQGQPQKETKIERIKRSGFEGLEFKIESILPVTNLSAILQY